MNRRTFLGGVGAGVVLLSGCLGAEGNALDPAADQNDDPAGDEQPAKPATDSPESTLEPTTEQPAEPTPEPTPEPTTDAPEDRIDFEREDDDPDVVGTLLTKGPVPGVVVSSDLPYAKAWQNYAETDEEAGTYRVGLSVDTSSRIGRLSVVGRVYDAEGDLVAEDTDVSNNVPADKNALIHLVFEGDLEAMYYFEVDLVVPN
ncbi:uncharacterized protein HfgLR_24275 (plasmid) [Haloferax gibbonsii]|uniref:Lipoprotein n=1 Tax=Haloferax gibbonsii TaxID=35746 RepID=A0A871BMU2_HALGI|nr:hypothetical protein [Haloferax gibbonsii]QOS14040.1 uncharacterized protein HfgLR_24275 [Haloferax gibbonsii]